MMKMIVILADASRLDALRAHLHDAGAPGYTVLPVAEGAGRTGVHSGDRVHPGALAMVLVIVEDARADSMFDGLVRWRDEAGDPVTRLFLTPVLRQA